MYIKICGISEQQHIDQLITKNLQAIGFVAYPPSPRFVTPEQVKKLIEKIPAKIAKVLVVVDMSEQEIQAYLDAGIDTLQFHGKETAEFAKQFNCHIWRAIRLKSKEQIDAEVEFPCEMFVIDSAPTNASLPGGTGHVGDWDLTQQFVSKSTKPVLVAGGIRASNVREAISSTGAQGLDLSSGVESAPGKKSAELIDQLFEKFK